MENFVLNCGHSVRLAESDGCSAICGTGEGQATQVEKTKAIGAFITQHMEEPFMQETLSERFGLPLTIMKQCFKSVFGTTIGNYLH